MKMPSHLSWLVAALLVVACDAEPETPDAGGPAEDAGTDASAPPDGGPDDAGGPDDGGAEDAEVVEDGGSPDSGPDAAAETDAGVDPAIIPAPRPIAPGSTAFTTSPEVQFRWALTAPADGARLEVCRDAACGDVRETLDVTGEETTTLVPPDPGASSRVFYFRLTGRAGDVLGRDTSPVWSFSVHGPVGAATGGTWGSTHDLDGDGLSEILGGAPGASTVRIFRGRSPIGGAPSPDTTIAAPPAVELGRSVTGVGDVDGDGLGDVAVGTLDEVLIYHGSAGGLPASLTTAAAASTLTGVGSPSSDTVAAAGDVDRDGYADLAVGLPATAPATGRVLIFAGGPSGLATSGTPIERADAGFGRSVAGGCDVDADGYADVIVGADEAAFVYPGGAAGFGTPVELFAGPSGAGFGASVACAGDVNGDGYPDVIVGAPTDHAAFVYHGAASGISPIAAGSLRKQPGETGVSTKHGEDFGAVVAAAGDVDGDGYGEVVVVAPEIAVGLADADFVGYAFVFAGGPTGIGMTSPGVSTAHFPDGRALGASMSVAQNRPQVSRYAGDVNGDGFGDLVTGAPLRDGGGSVLLNLGASDGLPSASVWLIGGSGLVEFGATVAALVRWASHAAPT